MGDRAVRVIESSVQQLLARRTRLVLAVSGGVDSAVLMDAVARLRSPEHRVVIASVDHGTGDAATEATARTLAAAAQHGLPAISERLFTARADEASWRAGRWAFLRQVAAAEQANVVTGHSHDDHIETVVMRLLRGASARGLAGLLAPSPIERPLLEHDRRTIREYAGQRGVAFVDDPTNESRLFLRNRIRLDLLPAIRRVSPRFDGAILRLSKQAAELRGRVDALATEFLRPASPGTLVTIDAPALSELSDDSLRLMLPAIVARVGITLDRRGVMRLAEMVHAAPGSSGQLSGGFEIVRSGAEITVLKRRANQSSALHHLRPSGETLFGGFRFLAEPAATFQEREKVQPDAWRIYIPRSAEPVVRQWHPGDRLTTNLSGGRRRVKRFFADAGVVGPLRIGWPVVLCGDDVVWIPGIKASQAAVRNEARMVHYTCERLRD